MVPQIVVLVWVVMLGAVVGSFLNVCIYRLPLEKSILWPGSHCPTCLRPVRAYDNIPILSWFILHGRCRNCGEQFSARYMFIELMTATLFGVVFWLETRAAPLGFCRSAIHLFLVAALIVATFIDLDLQVIPDSVTVPGMFMGLLGCTIDPKVCLVPITAPTPLGPLAPAEVWAYGLLVMIGWAMCIYGQMWLWWQNDGRAGMAESIMLLATVGYMAMQTFGLAVCLGLVGPGWPGWPAWLAMHPHWQGLTSSLTGLIVGAGLIWIVRVLGTAALKREAMGFGDVTLMAMVGAFLGWQATVVIFFMAPFMGLIVGMIQWLAKGNNVLPYGPYLSLAAAVTLLAWQPIWIFVAPRLAVFALLGPIWVTAIILCILPIFLIGLRRHSALMRQSVVP